MWYMHTDSDAHARTHAHTHTNFDFKQYYMRIADTTHYVDFLYQLFYNIHAG